jgi:hypothetical protein
MKHFVRPIAMRALPLAMVATLMAGTVGKSLVAQDTTRKPMQDSARQVRPDTARKPSSGERATPAKRATAQRPPEPEPLWPVEGPAPIDGSILPNKRIVAFYGNPLSKRMGILGELPPDKMLAKLDREVDAWNAADPETPVQPALHLIAVVAQADPGRDGKYRARMDSALIEKVYGWAQQRNALLFLDLQVAKSTLEEELPRLTRFLQRPDVHLAIDPEFSMKRGGLPGKKIGTFDADDVNYATKFLGDLVTALNLPPKVLVVHRFTRDMLTGHKRITLDPRVQIVIDMDGWGPPSLKRDSYRAYVYRYPVQFTGFKLFYKNDTKKGHPLMTPADVLALNPKPVYIQYQ